MTLINFEGKGDLAYLLNDYNVLSKYGSRMEPIITSENGENKLIQHQRMMMTTW
jgi:hypothetical protein